MSNSNIDYLGKEGDGYYGKTLNVEKYTVVKGIFQQSGPSSSPSGGIDLLGNSFGLIDKSPERWIKFEQHIKELNQEADDDTTYKVLYIARHGQGVHNLAEEKYGTLAWNAKWSLLYTDGELIWGPDPLLTEKGREQIRKTARYWEKEIKDGIPLPEVFYSSPLRRAIDTVEITWNGVLPNTNTTTRDRMIKENLREMIGLHTCDKRSTRSLLEKEYPNYHFDTSFTEEDELWIPDHQETDRQITTRARSFLDALFADDKRTFISITGHGGIIGGLMRSLGHLQVGLETGGMIPMVIKATSSKNGGVMQVQSDQPQDTTDTTDILSTSEAQSAGTILADAELIIQSP